MSRIRPACLVAAALALPALAAHAAPRVEPPATYLTPPQVMVDILTAPRLPRGAPEVSPDGARLLLPDLRSLIPIATLAEPVEKLAGLEILPSLRASRAALKLAAEGLSVVGLADGRRVRLTLPAGARIAGTEWSTRGDRVAVAVFAAGGADLWIADAATGAARRIEGVKLQGVPEVRMAWALDDRSILASLVPPGVSPPPAPSPVPAGPEVRESAGRAAPQRTARHVLRTAEEQERFVFYVTSQLAFVPLDGGPVRAVGEPVALADWALAPDERHIAIERLVGSPPLGFPYELFPSTLEIRGPDGARVATVGDSPLDERSAISSLARLGPRRWTWAPDGRSLWFASWRDQPGADPAAAIRDTTRPQPGADRVLRLDEPFTGEAREVMTSDMQVRALRWTADGARLVIQEGYEPRRVERWRWLDPARPEVAHPLVLRSTEGVYDDPGRLLAHAARHQQVLWTPPDGGSLWLAGAGFEPGGQRPFLARLGLADGRLTRIWGSEPGGVEQPLVLLVPDGSRFLCSRQSRTSPPNYAVRSERGRRLLALTHFADPAPALTAARRLTFTFTRSDSVRLNAEAVLPADWKPGRRLPTIFWIYPNDYRSAAAASQNRRSADRYPSQSPLNPEVLVTQGYAVVYPDIAVVGTNDRYVEEIRRSAEAALAACVSRGITDPARVGVGGHSYGAFSSANMLAHTRLFRAGIASDGAYNRTLTPFTFQAEERTLWQAPETYLRMSPFMAADSIVAPLLLLHNLDDTNVGTNPIQSERMFDALNGLGRRVGLVEYPYEDHGPVARETVLDYWARVLDWFDRYVKNARAGASAARPTGSAGS